MEVEVKVEMEVKVKAKVEVEVKVETKMEVEVKVEMKVEVKREVDANWRSIFRSSRYNGTEEGESRGNLKLCSHIVNAVDRRGEELNLCCRGSVRFQLTSMDGVDYVWTHLYDCNGKMVLVIC
ncbi:hypothetical protein M8J77_013906 [Diaphorina citri]|nr:hypothetical protein M8J77_013906 [Diaphorina citri]